MELRWDRQNHQEAVANSPSRSFGRHSNTLNERMSKELRDGVGERICVPNDTKLVGGVDTCLTFREFFSIVQKTDDLYETLIKRPPEQSLHEMVCCAFLICPKHKQSIPSASKVCHISCLE